MASSKAVGLLTFNFGANMQGFEKAMNKAQKKLKKFGKNIQKTGKSLTMGLTLPLVGLGAAALKFGSDLEETNAKFLTVFSSIQKEAEETAKVFKDSFGLSELAAKDMLSGTGDLLVGIGLTEGGALDLSKKINELAVDLASFTNFSGGAKGASEALTKALLGERDSIKSLGISITEADLKKFASDQGLVWKELDKGTRAMLTYELAAKQSFKAIGDFARTSGSFANQMRIVKGDLVDVASEMGSRLIPYAQAAIEKVKGLIKWFDGLSDSTKDNIVKWGLLFAAIGPVLIIIGKMSTGIGALIPAFTKLGLFLLANPYVLLAAAIVALGVAVYTLTQNLWGQYDAEKSLNDLKKKAIEASSEEITNIELLTSSLRGKTELNEEEIKNLNTLKKLYPSYYGQLDETTFSSRTLEKSTKNLTDALLDMAMIDTLKDRLQAVNTEIRDLKTTTEKGGVGFLATMLTEGSIPLKIVNEIQKKITKGQIDFRKILQKKFDTTHMKKLTDEKKELFEQIEELKAKYPEYGKEIEKVTHKINKLTEDTDELTDVELRTPFEIDLDELDRNHKLALNQLKKTQLIEKKSDDDFNKTLQYEEFKHLNNMWNLYNKYGEDVVDVDVKIMDLLLKTQNKLTEELPLDPFENYRNSLGKLGEKIAEFTDTDVKSLEEGLALMVEKLGNELAQGADSFEEYGKNILGVLREVIGGLISAGVQAALTKALMSSKFLPFWAIPIVAGAAAGLAKTAFNSLVPKFEKGGLITGPTTALIGEGIGTTAANPEVVAPLDKLRSMMVGGNQNITVTGKLVGNDIFLSNAKTGVNRLRTV